MLGSLWVLLTRWVAAAQPLSYLGCCLVVTPTMPCPQMVWEHGCTVIVMLSPLAEDSVKQCDRYWPDEGSSLYHIYEASAAGSLGHRASSSPPAQCWCPPAASLGQVNLVSEHIWCEDFLVRSFYLKNVQSQETRTLTQFHFLSWPAEGIPTTTRPLLDFRR